MRTIGLYFRNTVISTDCPGWVPCRRNNNFLREISQVFMWAFALLPTFLFGSKQDAGVLIVTLTNYDRAKKVRTSVG